MAETLTTVVEAAHQDAAHLIELSQADSGTNRNADPRQVLHASDAAVAALSAHLSAMECVIYPAMARRVVGGRARVADLNRIARRCASVMRGIEQYIQGDINRPSESVAHLRQDLSRLMAEHAKAEDELLRELSEALSEGERRYLLDRFADAMRHAPTRPHPHIGHSRVFGGSLAIRLAGHWDHLLDVMDAREVAGTPVRAPAPAGLWGWYLLGRPTQSPTATAEPSEPSEPSELTEPSEPTEPSQPNGAEAPSAAAAEAGQEPAAAGHGRRR